MRLTPLMARTWTARFALATAVLTLVALIVVNEWSHQRAELLEHQRTLLTQARRQSVLSLKLLADAESGQRGYLLTGREEYLKPLHTASAQLPQALAEMAGTLETLGFASTEHTQETQRLVALKMSEMDATIALYRAGKPKQASDLILTDIGVETMGALQRHLGGAIERVTQEQDAVAAHARRESQVFRWVSHALAVLIALASATYGRHLALETRQRESERERLQAAVQAQTADLRELAAYLQDAQERERALLSRELHDELGGLLTAAKLDLARLRTLREPAQLAERTAQLSKRLDEVIAIKRRIIEGLRPSSLQHLGLRAALEQLCQEVAERLGIPVDARIDDARYASDVEIAAFRVVQEALTNVQKYADAKHVQVRLTVAQPRLTVEVRDDGAGFDASRARVNRHGIAGMRYRVEALGGTFVVESARGKGTRVCATLPAGASPGSGSAA